MQLLRKLKFGFNSINNAKCKALLSFTLSKGFISFCLIFISYLLYLITTTYNFLPFDSGAYWRLGNEFVKEGEFSLLNYHTIYRGYLYPLINLPFFNLWKATGVELFAIIKIIGAFTSALFFGVAVPCLVQKVGKMPNISVSQRLLFSLLGFLFWRDYFNFTLTDFPALLLLIFCAIILFGQSKLRWMIIAGLLFGAAINFRPTYTICIPIIPAFVFFSVAKKNNAEALLKVLVFFTGFIIISIPQIIINSNLVQNYSPLVQAQYGPQKRNLYLSQLEWGLIIQKYESSFGLDYPSNQMVYLDPKGVEFVRNHDLSVDMELAKGSLNEIYGISNNHQKGLHNFNQYFKLVIYNPENFISIYLKHIFNGFDIQYATPYITNVYKVNFGLVIANFTILFIAFLIFFFRILPYLDRKQFLVLLIFIAPCLIAIPTAIEVRFFLPFHIMAYATIAFGFPRNWWKIISYRKKVYLIAGYLIFIGFCLIVSYNIQQTLMYKPRYLF